MDMPKIIAVYLWRDEDGDHWDSRVFCSRDDFHEWRDEYAPHDPDIQFIWNIIEIPEKERHL